MYLSAQFAKPSIIVPETFASFLLEFFWFRMGDWVRNNACKIFTKKLSASPPDL
jgi:hypothetical protein